MKPSMFEKLKKSIKKYGCGPIFANKRTRNIFGGNQRAKASLELGLTEIDVIWFEKNTNKLVSAYEVEKSTSIYSGILRLTDLALTIPNSEKISLYLVAPEQREKEIMAQLKRPSLIAKEGIKISYILFSELCTNCDSICKFGNDHTIMEKVAKSY